MKEIIVAYGAKNREIGLGGRMPWGITDMRDDMLHFRRKTLGATVVMGRRTYESIGRLLPDRQNIIVTKKRLPCGVETAKSLEQAYEMATNQERIIVIGGAMLYAAALELGTIGRVHATEIQAEFPDADRFFDPLPPEFVETAREIHLPDDRNLYPYDFVTFENRNL